MTDSENVRSSLNAVASEGGFSLDKTLSLVNQLTSTDGSIGIEGDGTGGPINLSMTVETDLSLSSILRFEFEKTTSDQDDPPSVIPGKHHLKVISTQNGILIAKGGKLELIEVPKSKAVLILKQDGSYDWSEAPAEDAVLGIKDGNPEWYIIDTCEGACTE